MSQGLHYRRHCSLLGVLPSSPLPCRSGGRSRRGFAQRARAQQGPPEHNGQWKPPRPGGLSSGEEQRANDRSLQNWGHQIDGTNGSDSRLPSDYDDRSLNEYSENSLDMDPWSEADLPRTMEQIPAQETPFEFFSPQQQQAGLVSQGNLQLLKEVWQDTQHFIGVMLADSNRTARQRKRYRYQGFTRLKYKLERAIWSDVAGQYGLLFITVGLVALTGGAVYSVVIGEDLPEALWHAQLFLLDGGTVSAETDLKGRVIGYILTIFGLLTVSVLVGIVNQTIERRVAAVTSQITRVLETDHIVVLNWNSSTPRLVNELMLGNRDTEANLRNNTIVVMSEEPQKTMIDACRGIAAGDAKGDILCIQGNPQSISDLRTVCASYARTIVILAEEGGSSKPDECDANGLSTMLALATLAEQTNTRLPRVVMEVHGPDTVGLVRRTFGDAVYPILVGSIAAKITVQTILMPGISRVFKDLLSFDGSEFYFLPVPPKLVGVPFGRLKDTTGSAIPVGLQRLKTGLELLPDNSEAMAEDDNVILLQRSRVSLDEATALLQLRGTADIFNSFYEDGFGDEESIESVLSKNESTLSASVRPALDALFLTLDDDLQRLGRSHHRKGSFTTGSVKGPVLLCGWRPGIGLVLKTLDRVMSFGSEVHMLSEVPLVDRDKLLTADGLDLDYISNIKLVHWEGSPGVPRDLRQLPLTNDGYTAVVQLANWQSEASSMRMSSADAIRKKSVLLLRDYLFQCMKDTNGQLDDAYWSTHYVTEVSGAGDVTSLPFSEFVEIGALDVMAISQVVFQPALHNLQMQLLNTGEGVHVTLEPVGTFCKPGEVATFKEVARRMEQSSEGSCLLIGYKSDAAVTINPDPNQLKEWEDYIELIVLNRTRTNKAHKTRQKELANKLRRRRERLRRALGSTELTQSMDYLTTPK